MENSAKRANILNSKTISESRLNSLIEQLKRIPPFWKKRFCHDDWQIILTDKMPEEYGGNLTRFFADSREKKIWLNVVAPDVFSNIIYIAFALYIILEYFQIKESMIFTGLANKTKSGISNFMQYRGNNSLALEQIFVEIFALVIETDGKNPFTTIDELYRYIANWVNGDIFTRNIYIPKFIEIGIDVTDEQIQVVYKTFQNLPQKLQQRFLDRNWKIKISKEKILQDDIRGCCSSFDKQILIRSSSIELQKTVWHEFGHYLDFEEGLISSKFSFKTIFYAEKNFFNKLYANNELFRYGTSDSKEYFAEVFCNYMANPLALKNCAYQSFKFIDDILKKWR